MTQDKDSDDKFSVLRTRAEETIGGKPSDMDDMSTLPPEEIQRLVHELRVHQIELEMQNEDLRQAQVKLEELKDRYLDLYDFAPVGYLTLNEKGLILEANLKAVRLLGEDRQTLIKRPFSRFVGQQFGDAYYLHLQQVFEAQSKQTCEIELVREDGTQFYAQLESIAIQDENGQFIRCRTIVTDISGRKRVEEALRESEECYRSFFDTSHDGVMITAVDGQLIDFNESAMEMLGYSVSDRAEMLDKDIGMFYANPDEREAHRDLVTTLGFSVDYPVDLRRQDDTVIHTLITVVARTGSHGKDMGFYWTVQDITERKKAEEVLRQSEGRNRFLAEVIENSSQPFGTGYPAGRLGIVNRAFCDLTGYTEEELRHIDWNVTLTPPEWLESEIQHLTELERTGKPVRYEKEYIRKDGTRVPIELLVHVVRGETGETLHYQAFLTDLTERKKAEKELKESEQRFRIIFDRAPLGIALVGLDYRLLMANKAYCDLLGYSEDELRQLQLSDFTHPDDLEENLRLQRELGSTKISSFQMEKRFIRKDGQISLGLLVASLLSDDSGIPQYFIGLVLDITEHKKAEEALIESEERVRMKLETIMSPEGEIGTLELADVIDAGEIQALMDDFYAITNIGVAILDLRGKVLVATGWQDICTKFHRLHPETQRNCIASDTQLSSGIAGGEFRLYRCLNNMWDIATPITVGGNHLGNLFLGQFLFEDEETDREYFYSQARKYGFDEEQYISALERVPRWSRETVDRVMRFYAKMARMVSTLSYGNIKLAKSLAERERLVESLRESEERYRTLVENLNDVVFSLNMDGEVTYVSPAVERITRYKVEDIEGHRFQRLVHPEDLLWVTERYRKIFEGEIVPYEYRLLDKDGRAIHVRTSSRPAYQSGQLIGLTGLMTDITDQKRSQEALRRNQSMLERTESIAHVGSWEWDVEADKVTWSEELFRIFDRNPGDGAPSFSEHAELYPPEDVERLRALVTEAVMAGTPYEIELRAIRKDGETRHCLARGNAEMGPQGRATRLFGSFQDITIKKQSEEKLRKSESLLKTVLRAAPVGIGLARDRSFEWVNEYASEMTGYSEKELLGQSARILYETDEEFKRAGEAVYGRIRTLGTGSVETRWRRKDGTVMDVYASASAVDPQDLSAGVVFSSIDISAQKRAMDEIQRSHGETKSLLNGTKALLEFRHFQDSARGLFDICTAAIGAKAGYVALLSEDGAENEVLFLESGGVPCSVDPSLPMPIRGLRAEAYRTGKVVYENDFLHSQWMEFMPDGHADLENVLFAPLVVGDRAVGLLGMANKEGGFNEADARIAKAFADLASIGLLNSRNMDALEESEERTRLLIESAPIGIRVARDGKFRYANPAFLRMFGYETEDEVIGLPVEELYAPESRELVASGLRKPAQYEVVARSKNGKQLDVEVWCSDIDFQGKRSSLAFVIDVSEGKKLRSQLLQAQKMEAIGTLAGGIAHDFNNILQVVCGFSEIILTGKEKGDPEYEDLQKVWTAGRKGADLVQRLLTFSRKSEINPKPLNLNQQIQRVESILERTIPKIIKIDSILADGLSAVNADSTQVEQILMNLAVNARDAMPEGGRLIFETSNVTLDQDYCNIHMGSKPGHYVLLMVSDTGEGMEKTTLEHIFEPFFSTKPSGKGTGLGLAMVYGIVKQHGGYVTCYSEPGVGTTFKLYFPVTEMKEEALVHRTETKLPGGSETILVVDDEQLIRDLAKRILSRAGYSILTAANGNEAVQIYEKMGPRVSLILLDLIMPEMDGKECLRELLRINPAVRVVVASGYSADGPTKEALQGGARGFVAKPFDMGQLLQTVRKVLDED